MSIVYYISCLSFYYLVVRSRAPLWLGFSVRPSVRPYLRGRTMHNIYTLYSISFPSPFLFLFSLPSLFPSVYPSPFLLFPFPTALRAAWSAVWKGKRRKGEGYTLGKREGKEKRKSNLFFFNFSYQWHLNWNSFCHAPLLMNVFRSCFHSQVLNMQKSSIKVYLR